MSLASRQRDSLCDLMSELGPLAPTMCDGWNVGDLAAHLWIREHKPASLPGIGSQQIQVNHFAGLRPKAIQHVDSLVHPIREGNAGQLHP